MKGHSNNGLNLNNFTKTSGIFLLIDGAIKLRFISVLCLVIEKTSFGNLDNSPGYEEPILVYCGNGHQAYQAEIKSLYPDVALAQEAGISVKILKKLEEIHMVDRKRPCSSPKGFDRVRQCGEFQNFSPAGTGRPFDLARAS